MEGWGCITSAGADGRHLGFEQRFTSRLSSTKLAAAQQHVIPDEFTQGLPLRSECGGELRVIAFITERNTIRNTLTHLDATRPLGSRAPP